MTEQDHKNQHSQPDKTNQEQGHSSHSNGKAEDASVLGELDAKLNQLQTELNDYKDRYLRSVAEMENMKRRSERDRIDLVKYALEGLMKDVVPVMDGLEKALTNSEKDSASPLYQGLQMLHKQIVSVLGKHGLEEINSVGKPFDPNLHQAIQTIESSDVDSEQVHQEFAKGYSLHGRLIRPAIVSVATPNQEKSK